MVITGLIAWMIPDVPAELKIQIRKEAYISNEIVIKTELLRAQGKSPESVDTIAEAVNEYTPEYMADDSGSVKLVQRKTPTNSPEREVENVV